MDSTRKEMFGVHGVYGEEPNLEIRGFNKNINFFFFMIYFNKINK